LTSVPLRVAVTTTRLVADSFVRKGALAEAASITATGRRKGWSHDASSLAETSGPRIANFASLPSNVPCPMKTSQSSIGPSFGSLASAC
jgi:hypothetical protein